MDSGSNYCLVPPPEGWWAYNTGLTPCVLTSVFNQTQGDFCVLVLLVPRLIYHKDTSFIDEFDHCARHERKPVSLALAILLGVGVVAGIGTGTAALKQAPQRYKSLRAAIDEDLKTIKQSISKFKKSLTSLSEVVLQNRRGLDLLFL